MQAGGASDSWAQAKDNQIRIFDLFLVSVAVVATCAAWGNSFGDLPEEVACGTEVWGRFATFLVETCVIEQGRRNAGKHLDIKSACGIWDGVLHQAAKVWVPLAAPERKVRPIPAQRCSSARRASLHARTHVPMALCLPCPGLNSRCAAI